MLLAIDGATDKPVGPHSRRPGPSGARSRGSENYPVREEAMIAAKRRRIHVTMSPSLSAFK
jgi:hypothetical protein